MMEYPKLRPIEAIPTTLEGKKVIMLRDPSSISDKILFVSPDTFFIISLMDGTHSILDIQVQCTRRLGGMLITSDKIKEIINQLDDVLFLESEKFNNYIQNLKDEFNKSKVRKAYLKDKVYPADKDHLSAYFYNLFLQVKKDDLQESKKKILGIISPHIDYHRGGQCYAYAYSELWNIQESTTFIIFGTSHFNGKSLFVLTKKDFETPFGILKNDTEFIEKLEKKLDKNLCEEEFIHRQEHSIELQTIFLKYILQNQNIKIVPILCGSFHKFIQEGTSPSESQEIIDFVSAIKELTSEIFNLQSSICFIAGADLSHVGLNFGDSQPVTYADVDEIKEKDLKMLKFVENLDAEGFYKSIAEERDRRRICGLPPIYLLLKTIDTQKSKLLNYDYWFDRNSGSLVSFASLSFY